MGIEIRRVQPIEYGNESLTRRKKEVKENGDPSNDVEPKKEKIENEKKEAVDPKTGKAVDPIQEIKVKAQVAELAQIQNKVIAHERAHMSAGGDLASGASYSYTTGPDGKKYITGGEVSIHTPAVKEPEEKIRVMARVRAAALAPVDPSGQDMRVAASASAKEAEGRIELARKKVEEAYGNTQKVSENPNPKKSEIKSSNQSNAAPINPKSKKTPSKGLVLDIEI